MPSSSPTSKKAAFVYITDEAFDALDDMGIRVGDGNDYDDDDDDDEPAKPAPTKPKNFALQAPLTYTESGPPITEADLKPVEKAVGCDLPDDYRAFLLKTNGGKPSRTAFGYEDLEGHETSTEIDEFFSVIPKSKADNDLVRNIKFWWDSERIIDTHVPIARDIAGNIIVLSVDEDDYGPVYFFDCDVEGDYEPDENWVPLADSFQEFLYMLKKAED